MYCYMYGVIRMQNELQILLDSVCSITTIMESVHLLYLMYLLLYLSSLFPFSLSQLVESCAQIAGACLEQTTWLRRNLAVREEEPVTVVGTKEKEGSGELHPYVTLYLFVYFTPSYSYFKPL